MQKYEILVFQPMANGQYASNALVHIHEAYNLEFDTFAGRSVAYTTTPNGDAPYARLLLGQETLVQILPWGTP